MSTILRHTIYWTAIYLLWTYMKSFGQMQGIDFIINFFNVAIFMMIFYLLRHVQIPLLYNRDKPYLFILSLIASASFFVIFWYQGMHWLDIILGDRYKMRTIHFGGLLLDAVQSFAPSIGLLAWESQNDRQKELDRIHLLEKEKIESELKYLKTQINPKFLTNTLNNLHTSVIEKSPEAPDMIMKLSGILDFVLYKSQKELIPIHIEMESIDNFIALEKNRFGDRLLLNYQRPELLQAHISPLVLLSYIENLFQFLDKIAISKLKVEIEFKENVEHIICQTKFSQNVNQQFKDSAEFKEISHQLNLIYPDQHELIVEKEIVLLTIKNTNL